MIINVTSTFPQQHKRSFKFLSMLWIIFFVKQWFVWLSDIYSVYLTKNNNLVIFPCVVYDLSLVLLACYCEASITYCTSCILKLRSCSPYIAAASELISTQIYPDFSSCLQQINHLHKKHLLAVINTVNPCTGCDTLPILTDPCASTSSSWNTAMIQQKDSPSCSHKTGVSTGTKGQGCECFLKYGSASWSWGLVGGR